MTLEQRTLRDMGELLAKAFGLACETRPQVMRTALERVFNLKGMQAAIAKAFDAQPAMVKLEKAMKIAIEAAKEMRELDHEFRRLKDSIELDLENLEARLDLLTVAAAKANGKPQGAKP